MSSEIFGLIEALSYLLSGGILAFGAYRAMRMGRAFVNSLYRSRARWTAGAIWLLVVSVLGSLISPPSSAKPALITLPPFLPIIVFEAFPELALLGFLVAIFAFVDRTILVTMDMDFFHRSVFRWPKVRIPFYILLFLGLIEVLGNSILGGLPPSQVSRWEIYAVGSIPTADGSWFPLFLFALLIVVFGYSAAAMVAGARRTSDMTLRKHVRFLGIAIISFFVAIATSTLTTYSFASYPSASLVPDVLYIITAYLFYRVAMSLSPLGRVEREVEAAGPKVTPSSP